MGISSKPVPPKNQVLAMIYSNPNNHLAGFKSKLNQSAIEPPAQPPLNSQYMQFGNRRRQLGSREKKRATDNSFASQKSVDTDPQHIPKRPKSSQSGATGFVSKAKQVKSKIMGLVGKGDACDIQDMSKKRRHTNSHTENLEQYKGDLIDNKELNNSLHIYSSSMVSDFSAFDNSDKKVSKNAVISNDLFAKNAKNSSKQMRTNSKIIPGEGQEKEDEEDAFSHVVVGSFSNSKTFDSLHSQGKPSTENKRTFSGVMKTNTNTY